MAYRLEFISSVMQPEHYNLLRLIGEATCSKELRTKLFSNGELASSLSTCEDINQALSIAQYAFQRLVDLDKLDEWDEFKDKSCTDWKRVRSAIEHENNLTNHRLSWLFATQLFLFGGFATIFQGVINKDPKLLNEEFFQLVLSVFPLIGIVVCIIIFVSLHAAGKQIESLENWWFYNYLSDIRNITEFKDTIQHTQPPINGIFDDKLYHLFGIKWLPLVLSVAWVWVCTALWLEKISKVQQPMLPTILITCIFMGLTWIVWKYLQAPGENKRWRNLIDLPPKQQYDKGIEHHKVGGGTSGRAS